MVFHILGFFFSNRGFLLEEHSHGKPRRNPDSPRFTGNPELLSIKILSAVKVGRVMCPCRATLRVDHNKDSIFMDVGAIKVSVFYTFFFFSFFPCFEEKSLFLFTEIYLS